MSISTFGGFTTARLSLLASQRAIDVAGQNLSNVNTPGYTRQRLDLLSISPVGNGYASSPYDSKVGQGVEMAQISQIRDPYLDIQYRNQIAKVGQVDATDEILDRIGKIFDETDATAIRAGLDNLISSLHSIANPTTGSAEVASTVVKTAFEKLTHMFTQSGTEIDALNKELRTDLEQNVMGNLNALVDKITTLNVTIKNTQALGNPALELQDERNMLLDELAVYLPIEVNSQKDEQGIECLNVSIKGGDGKKISLITDNISSDIQLETSPEGDFSLSVVEEAGTVTALDMDKIESGLLKGKLEMLNQNGNFDGSEVKGIGFYETFFNSFVNQFATTVNEINSKPNTDPELTDIFVKIDDSKPFSATNMKLSEGFVTGNTKITLTKSEDPNSTNYDNVLTMIDALTKVDYDVKSDSGETIFTGNMQELYDNIQNVYAGERSTSKYLLETRISIVNSISDGRDSVSAVSQDEEVMDLMRFQQSYNAASRFMTTLDELIDKLVNSTGITGR